MFARGILTARELMNRLSNDTSTLEWDIRRRSPGVVIETEERQRIPDLPRELLGNPFRPSVVLPAWKTTTVLQLVQTIYDGRDLTSGILDAGRIAVLADALEEAGCNDAAILGHCREPRTHVRGCWVVDLLLGKA